MLKIKITWPLALIILVALFLWLIRAAEAQSKPRPSARSRRAARRQPASRNGHHKREPFVIQMDATHDGDAHPADCAGGSPDSDYDAETERLDREAAESARAVHSAYQSSFTMPKGSWQK